MSDPDMPTEDELAAGPAFTFAFRYGCQGIRQDDTLMDAIRLAGALADNGDEAMNVIEVPSTGRTYGLDVVDAVMEPRRQQAYQEMRERPKPQATVVVLAPDGREAEWDSFGTTDAAEEAAAALRPVFGDRVRVVPVGAAPILMRDTPDHSAP